MSQGTKKINFDQVITRRGTNCAKWDLFDQRIGIDDLIHVGCADMDFKAPAPLRQRLQEVVEHGIFGYSEIFADFFAAIIRYYKHYHQVELTAEQIVFCPRINVACGLCTTAFTAPGDAVMIHTPSYPPLRQAVVSNGRHLKEVPLEYVPEQNIYQLSFAKLEQALSPQTKMLILVNPQNPTTRVFSEQELLTVAQFCEQHDLLLFVDEIHGDLCREDVKFTSCLHLPEQYRQRIILANSPAKSFNIPGLGGSFVVIPNEDLRQRFKKELAKMGEESPNVFFNAALITAYTECDEYLKQLRPYIDGNERYMTEAFQRLFPKCQVTKREGSYLLWIDMRQCFADEESLKEFFFEKARVGVYLGGTFGKGYECYIRFNLGAPRAVLAQIVMRLENALAGRPYDA